MSLVDDAIAAARRAGIDPNIFVRQIQQESGFNPNAVSPAGAQGIAQFMPSTAAGLGINPWNPVQALNAAAQYMANSLRAYGGDYAKALAAYNAGGGTVNYAIARGGRNWQAYLPAETQNYIRIILGGRGNPPPTPQPTTKPKPTPVASPHLLSPSGLPHAVSIAPHEPLPSFGQPHALTLAPQPAPTKPKTIFGIALSVPRQISTPKPKPKMQAPRPAPKPVPKKPPRGIS